MDDPSLSRRRFVAYGATAATAGSLLAGGRAARAQEGDPTETAEEEFVVGRDLQLIGAAALLAVLSPIAFAALLFLRGTRGRGPA